MNQLQKDIKIALSWFSFLPIEKMTIHDSEAFKRLECYMEKDLEYETYTGEYLNDSHISGNDRG